MEGYVLKISIQTKFYPKYFYADNKFIFFCCHCRMDYSIVIVKHVYLFTQVTFSFTKTCICNMNNGLQMIEKDVKEVIETTKSSNHEKNKGLSVPVKIVDKIETFNGKIEKKDQWQSNHQYWYWYQSWYKKSQMKSHVAICVVDDDNNDKNMYVMLEKEEKL